MIGNKMRRAAEHSSAVRAMFEEGNRLAARYGRQNVYDFSLGNPAAPAPPQSARILAALAADNGMTAHGYMSNAGFPEARRAVADDLNRRFATAYTENNIVMSVGAAGGLNVALKCLLDPDDEVILFAPYFGEYRHYVENFGGKVVAVKAPPPRFLPDTKALAQAITPRTKAVVINTPNNPTGVVYGAETLAAIADVLRARQRALGTEICLIADEPYRELVYDTVVPWAPDFYENTVVVYSYSKSYSLPGERIGWICVPDRCADADALLSAASVATRILGFVNAPALQQRLVSALLEEGVSADVALYRRNRDLLTAALRAYGYRFTDPEGAFYLFLHAPHGAARLCDIAKKHRVLLVDGASFGCPDYARLAYCVPEETVRNALPAFLEIARECGFLA